MFIGVFLEYFSLNLLCFLWLFFFFLGALVFIFLFHAAGFTHGPGGPWLSTRRTETPVQELMSFLRC